MQQAKPEQVDRDAAQGYLDDARHSSETNWLRTRRIMDEHFARHRATAEAAARARALEEAEPALEILEGYIGFLHRMPADELELHPYIPAVEEAFDRLSSALRALKEKDR